MSNLHVNLDEANKHTPKGFDLVGNNTFPTKDENGLSTYEERMSLPKAINFVDGTLAAPSTSDGDIFVLTGSGTIHPDWGSATFDDWVRFTNSTAVKISPLAGYLCFDVTANEWKEYDGADWVTHDDTGATNLSEGATTTTTVDVDSSTGTNATLNEATSLRAGVMSSAKFDEVEANTLKVTNATHTGEVSGSGALTAQPTIISNKTTLGSLSGTEEFLINDGGVLKKVLASNVGVADGNGIYDGSGSLSADTTVTMGANDLILTSNSATYTRLQLNNTQTSGASQFEMLGSDGSYSQKINYNPTVSGGWLTNSFGDLYYNRIYNLAFQGFGNTSTDVWRVKTTPTSSISGHLTRMTMNGNGEFNIGASSPTSGVRLTVEGQTTIKGINQLGTSTALLVEDSAGTDLLKVANDGSTTINGQTRISNTSGTGKFHVKGTTGGDTLVINTDSSSTSVDAINVVQNDALTSVFKMNAQGVSYWQGNLAKLHIGASGTTAVGTAMINVKGSTNTSGGRNLYITKNNGDVLVNSYDNGTFALAQSGIDFNCRLQIQGLGATSGTRALLVENSGGQDILVCRNDNAIGLYGATPTTQATTGITAGAFVANTSGTVDDSATYAGYTIGQIAQALKDLGVLA